MLRAYETFPERGLMIPKLLTHPVSNAAEFEYIAGETLAAQLFWSLLNRDDNQLRKLMLGYRKATESLCPTPGRLVHTYDLSFPNLIVRDHGFYLVDVEIMRQAQCRIELAYLRALFFFSKNLQGLITKRFAPSQHVPFEGVLLPRIFCEILDCNPAVWVADYLALEKEIIAQFTPVATVQA